MDVTPQLIEQIEFSEKFRGYDPDQVDDFLERVGSSLSQLLVRNEELQRRLDEAERALQEAPAPAAAPAAMTDDEEIEQATRTLMLAKRTAEAAISEARAEAAKLVADARTKSDNATRDASTEAERLVRDAQLQREELIRKAKDDAEQEFAGQRQHHQDEVDRLEAERRRLATDVEAIQARIDAHRSGLQATVQSLQQLLEDPHALAALPPLDVDTASVAATARSPFYSTGAVAAVRVPDEAVQVVPDVPEGVPGDPWGPGSWSEVADGEGSERDAELFDAEGGDNGEPTQAYQQVDQVIRLDDPRDEEADEAMTAFFEGEEPSGRGRFRRAR